MFVSLPQFFILQVMTDYEYIIKQAKKLYYTQWSEEELRKCVDMLPALEREELVSLCHCKWIKKVMKENDIYLHATKGMLKKHRINLTNDDVRRIVNGFYTNPNDFSKRPLSKFRTDLSKDMGLV